MILTGLAGVDQITLGQSQKGKGTRISVGSFASASHYLRLPCEEQRGLGTVKAVSHLQLDIDTPHEPGSIQEVTPLYVLKSGRQNR